VHFIGSGGFGDVHEGEWRNIPDSVSLEYVPRIVVKKFRVASAQTFEAKARIRLLREIAVWHILKHDNIVPFVGVIHPPESFPSLISEYMHNGSVKAYVLRTPSVCLCSIFLGIALGLQYLHEYDNTIIHGDLKADNVLVNRRGCPCLCDFGLSRMIADNSLWNTSATSAPGTTRWQSPELLNGSQPTVTVASDIYAYAMTCCEIMTNRVPFHKYSSDVQVALALVVRQEKLERPDSTSMTDELWELIKLCSSYVATERPTTARILEELGPHDCDESGGTSNSTSDSSGGDKTLRRNCIPRDDKAYVSPE